MSQRHRRMRGLALCALLCCFYLVAPPLTASAQQQAPKRPITHEDVWLAKRVGAPVPSPDGRWLVFPVVEPAYEEKDQVSDLWIMAVDGDAAPRRLTFSKGGESDLAWSHDSRRLAFSAKREGDEVNQIYVMNVADGGEAVKFTALSTGARAPRWQPDGRALLFVSNVYPGAADEEANKKSAADRKARKYKARVYESFPVRYWDKWLEETQPHLFTQSDEPNAQPRDLLANTNLVAARGFGGRQTDTGEVIDAVWTPDGQSVVFAATTGRDTAAYARYNTHLYLLPAAGGQPQQLTQGADDFVRPRFSPDGKTLACVYTRTGEKLYTLDRLALFSWPSTGAATPRVVTDKFDRSIGSFAFAPDGKSLYFTAEDAGHENVYSVPAAGGEVQTTLGAERGVYTNLAVPEKAARTVLLATWESATNPAEVVRLDPAAKSHQALTRFNRERAAAVDWRPLEHFWFTGTRGQKIHSMIALPPDFDENRKYPLFVLMHGGPHTMWRDQFFVRWNYHLLARPGYVVLLTNYTGSTGFGESFAQGIQGDPLAGPAEEINQAADEAIRRYKFIDGTKQAAGGASYGGHLANWMQATTARYKCLISHAGLINLESQWGTSDVIYSRELSNGGPVWEQGGVWREQNPIRRAKNFRTPILVTVGENDFRVPLNQSLENWSVLQRLRIPSRLIVFPEENHWIQKGENSRFFYQEVHQWLAKYLLAAEPPATSSR